MTFIVPVKGYSQRKIAINRYDLVRKTAHAHNIHGLSVLIAWPSKKYSLIGSPAIKFLAAPDNLQLTNFKRLLNVRSYAQSISKRVQRALPAIRDKEFGLVACKLPDGTFALFLAEPGLAGNLVMTKQI